MTARQRIVRCVLALAAFSAAGAAALEITDARIDDRTGLSLDRALTEAAAIGDEAVWVAWEVPGIEREGRLCCGGNGGCCEVESSHDLLVTRQAEVGPVAVLLRLSDGEVDRVRTVGERCAVGFSDRRLLWLGTRPEIESLDLLSELAALPAKRVASGALAAIAYHAADDATARLEAFAVAGDRHAEEAAFWLGTARREAGLEALRRRLASAPNRAMRKHLVFALAQSPIDGARTDLVRLAREDADEETRREALFWLGQDHAGRAADLIYEAALKDPSPRVAEHAVFVLSQLPKEMALDRLARLMTQEQRPELRKQALFWLAQTDSDRALEIVAAVLRE